MAELLSRLLFYAHFGLYFFAGPRPDAECGQIGDAKYCVHRAPRPVADDPSKIVYFLHYAEGDERSWVKTGLARVYYSAFRGKGAAPVVVTVSYGPFWNLLDKGGPKPGGGKYAHFTKELMPFVEKKLGGSVKRRYLWGMSQGGFNASLLLMKKPGAWGAAVIACPALYTISVFETGPALDEYVARTKADRETAVWGLGIFNTRVAGPAEWAREDPLVRARRPPKLPSVLIQSTTGDAFGFHEGAVRFNDALRAAGRDSMLETGRGRHCQVDARSAAEHIMRDSATVVAGN